MIELLKEFETDCVSILKHVKGHYEGCCAGENNGDLGIYVKKNMSGSSTYIEKIDGTCIGEKRTVPVSTIDSICQSKKLRGPTVSY